MYGSRVPRPWPALAALIFTTALAGCAASPDPDPDIEAARTLVTEAERAGAPAFASAGMQTAREHLQQAEEAAAKNRDEDAQRHAVKAGVDARLAMAEAAAAKAESAAEETARGVDALRDEANRPEPTSATPTSTP